MTPYKNLSGNSNVTAYEISDDSITVQFKSGNFRNYLYTHQTPGVTMVEKLKELALQGRGLNSYIKTNVKTRFLRKW